jgi:hypothetical protein
MITALPKYSAVGPRSTSSFFSATLIGSMPRQLVLQEALAGSMF